MTHNHSLTWRKVLHGLAMMPALLCAPLVHADEPEVEMVAASRAIHFTIDIYTVKKGSESTFLTGLLRSGPYDQLAIGFGGEKVIEVLPPNRNADPQYIVLGRYFNGEMGTVTSRQRQPSMARLASAAPMHLPGKLEDVILSDWSWERNRNRSGVMADTNFVRTMPYQGEQKVFQEHTASLNFMKIGYVGQTASVEFFGPDTSLDQLRKSITARPGLFGTAIISLGGGAGYAAYSEYYELPPNLKSTQLQRTGTRLSGALRGIVAENYITR